VTSAKVMLLTFCLLEKPDGSKYKVECSHCSVGKYYSIAIFRHFHLSHSFIQTPVHPSFGQVKPVFDR